MFCKYDKRIKKFVKRKKETLPTISCRELNLTELYTCTLSTVQYSRILYGLRKKTFLVIKL